MRAEVAAREVDPRYPRSVLARFRCSLCCGAAQPKALQGFPKVTHNMLHAVRSFMIAPEGTTKPGHCLLRWEYLLQQHCAWSRRIELHHRRKPSKSCKASNPNPASRFSVGGFAPGVAVQPILLDYSANKRFNPGWGLDESTLWHMWRVFTQLRTHIRLQVLPVSCAADCDACQLLKSRTPQRSEALFSET